MVCARCIAAVEDTFSNAGIALLYARLGEVETTQDLEINEIENIEKKLNSLGFEILTNAAKQEVEKVKTFIIVTVNSLDIPEGFVLSKAVSAHVNKEYSSISKNFSQLENLTLEQFFIIQKIEKAKELLSYNEKYLSEIATCLGYKSVQHLSSQFKNATGFSPSEFKKTKLKNRLPLDEL